MAFTDPIVAGDELVRAAINSSNYVSGVDGWRIARNGAAEFDSLAIRDNLNTNTITLDGVDLNTRLLDLPRGTLAYIVGYPTVATVTETRCMYFEVDLEANRNYEVYATNITSDISNPNATEFRLRWEWGVAPPTPTPASALIAMSLRTSAFQMAPTRHMFWCGATARFKFALFVSSLDGANVRTWCPGAGCNFGIIDHGKAIQSHPGIGTVGSGPIGKTLKEWTISAKNNKCYNANGTWRGPDIYDDSLIQGDFLNGRGNQRSWFTFDAAGHALLDDLIGVPLVDIDICELSMSYYAWQNGAGWASIGYHPHSGPLPNNEPGGGAPGQAHFWYTGTGTNWLGLKGVANIMNSLNSGFLNGFMIGNSGGTNQDYAGIAGGFNMVSAPQLHVRYYK